MIDHDARAHRPVGVKVRLSGRVQGVGFRNWTERQAGALGLSGWVRNCADGTVEAVFAGQADKVDEMLDRARDGPRMARVEAVEIVEHDADVPTGPFRTVG